MLRMCASNSHSYTHLILALGIVRKPTVWGFITSKYPGTHDIGLPSMTFARLATVRVVRSRGMVNSSTFCFGGGCICVLVYPGLHMRYPTDHDSAFSKTCCTVGLPQVRAHLAAAECPYYVSYE